MSTRGIIPVDLNDMLCRVEGTLSAFYEVLGDEHRRIEFDKYRYSRLEAMEDVLWNETLGQWLDYNMVTKKHGAASLASVSCKNTILYVHRVVHVRLCFICRTLRHYGVVVLTAGLESSMYYELFELSITVVSSCQLVSPQH